ncbi:MAG TPA: Dabb family protein [Phycisphaerales bacterium]|nr:Dabb family protein [Phycisphaerales bacterium]
MLAQNRIVTAVLAGTLAVGLTLAIVPSRAQPESGPAARMPPRPAVINHVVFFKLKDSADAARLIDDCDRRLARIPGITSYFCGSHIDTGRPTVETEYDVAFYVGFDTLKDYAAYVDHPLHVAVVAEWRPRFEWIKVYDVHDETP